MYLLSGSSEALLSNTPLPVLTSVAPETRHAPGTESLHWFAVYTNSHHEKRVAEHFGLRQIENFLPLHLVRRQWRNRSTPTLQLPIFPNYVFVRIARRECLQVLAVPGVLSIVSRGRDLVPLSDFEIETLRSGAHLRNIEPHPYLKVGTRVRIRCGALAGLEGVLIRKKNDLRVVLTLDQIMKSIAVEVEADEVDSVTPPLSGVANYSSHL